MFIRWQSRLVKHVQLDFMNWHQSGLGFKRLVAYGCDGNRGWEPRKKATWGYPLKDGRILFDETLQCVLVESHRIDGKPRQSHIAVLGSIRASLLPEFFEDVPADELAGAQHKEWEWLNLKYRYSFWKEAADRLARLSNRIPADQLPKIHEMLARRIPPLLSNQIAEVEARHAEYRAAWGIG